VRGRAGGDPPRIANAQVVRTQTHMVFDTIASGRLVMAFLPDPSTFEGALVVAVAGALLAALIVGGIGWFRHRRRQAAGGRSRTRISEGDLGGGDVADLATGIRQAVMAVREALQLFGRAVLLDPNDGSLEDNSREVLIEAHRTVDEAEARVPRVQLALGDRADEARHAVEELRQALAHLDDYIRQPRLGRRLEHGGARCRESGPRPRSGA